MPIRSLLGHHVPRTYKKSDESDWNDEVACASTFEYDAGLRQVPLPFQALIAFRAATRAPESPPSDSNLAFHLTPSPRPNMANFFDLKARKAAAAASASGEDSSRSAGPKTDNRLQPWVEK